VERTAQGPEDGRGRAEKGRRRLAGRADEDRGNKGRPSQTNWRPFGFPPASSVSLCFSCTLRAPERHLLLHDRDGMFELEVKVDGFASKDSAGRKKSYTGKHALALIPSNRYDSK
jgi:hypothetical protein